MVRKKYIEILSPKFTEDLLLLRICYDRKYGLFRLIPYAKPRIRAIASINILIETVKRKKFKRQILAILHFPLPPNVFTM